MDMHLIYDTPSSTHELHRNGPASLRASLTASVKASALALLLLVTAALSLAIFGPAQAGAEVMPSSEHLGGALVTPLVTPTVLTIEPSSGPTAGGTAVKIKGTEFLAGATVTIGGAAATEVIVVSAEEITAKTPAGSAGPQKVVVNDASGPSSAGAEFTYVEPTPVVSAIEPSSGPTAGGTAVKIKGTGFLTGATVTFGGKAATEVMVKSEQEITAKTPAGLIGPREVIVSDSGGDSSGVPEYTYVAAPTVTGVSPAFGPAAGGTKVTITGTKLTGASAVKFGAAAASGLKVNSESSIEAVSPAGTGRVHVTVTTSGGTTTTGAADEFSYAPIVTSIGPSSGPTAGGTAVTITGANLTGATAVEFGAAAATGLKVNSGSSIEAVSPAGTGKVHVTVISAGGTSATGAADEFTYVAPVVTPEGGTTTTGGGGGTTTSPPPPPPPPAGLPAPVLARSANVAELAGRVSVRLPGARAFVNLSSARQIPFGTIIEATHGEVSVTAAKAGGGTQRGQFFDGEFVLSQAGSGRVLATLAGGNFSVCRPQAGTARAKSKPRGRFAASTHLVRRLWAEGHGNFSTRARYAGSVVQGAQWLTEDMCEGSLILATREHVEVTDLVRHSHRLLSTGGIYLAKPR